MTLTLRIENHDHLPDGGPLAVAVDERGIEVGRDAEMGWTLPDPNRFISGRHFEIRHDRGSWWLHDLSTNGTFVNGATGRVKSPYRLNDGDRLQVGHYRIAVAMDAGAPMPNRGPGPAPSPAPGGFAPGPAPAGGGDIWSTPGATPPASGFDARGPRRPGPDFGDEIVNLGGFQPGPMPGSGRTPPPPTAPDPAGSPFGAAPPAWAPSAPPQPMPGVHAPPPGPGSGFAGQPAAYPQPSHPPTAYPPSQPPAGYPPSQPPAAYPPAGYPPPQPPAAYPPAGYPPASQPPQAIPGGDAAALLDAICAGAGLPPGSLSQGNPAETAAEIGRALRVVTEDLAVLLRARTAAKQSVRSTRRTMLGAERNNPLKFLPDTQEVLLALFGRPRPGYQHGAEAIRAGFTDVKRHQYAVTAALQPALARLLEDLAPEAIEARAGGGLLSSRKARAWEIFVERWDAKTHPHENGMLDVFLAYFAESYDRGTADQGGGQGGGQP
jgi:type VI secretion system protein ImpI